jgi:hypothetical protein
MAAWVVFRLLLVSRTVALLVSEGPAGSCPSTTGNSASNTTDTAFLVGIVHGRSALVLTPKASHVRTFRMANAAVTELGCGYLY